MDTQNKEIVENKIAECAEARNGEEKQSLPASEDEERLEIKADGKEKLIELTVVVEELRFIVYVTFVTIILLGMMLTTLFTEYFIPYAYDKIITDSFGYTNVCAFFDQPPATYVLPSIYAFALFFTYNYVLVSIFRARIAKEEGKISGISFTLLTAAYVYFGIAKTLFCTCFAVQPDQSNPSTIIVHTAPFVNLCVALSVLQVAVTWFGKKVAWNEGELNAPKWLQIASYVTVIGIIPATILKVIHQVNALSDLGIEQGISHGKGWLWNVSDGYLAGKVADVFWLLFSFLFPMIQSGYLASRGFDTHTIILQIGDNRKAKVN